MFIKSVRGDVQCRNSDFSEMQKVTQANDQWCLSYVSNMSTFSLQTCNSQRYEKLSNYLHYSCVSFYDYSFLRHSSSRTEHSRLVVHRCRNPSDLSLLSALLSSFPVRTCFFSSCFSAVLFKLTVILPHMPSIKKTDCPLLQKGVKRKSKAVTLETKMLVIRKMGAGEKRANVCSSLGLAQATVTLFLMSSEPRPGPSSTK